MMSIKVTMMKQDVCISQVAHTWWTSQNDPDSANSHSINRLKVNSCGPDRHTANEGETITINSQAFNKIISHMRSKLIK